MNDENPKPPLGYRNYSDDRPERRRNIGAFFVGFFIGIVVIALGVFVVILNTLDIGHGSTTRPTHPDSTDIFFASAAGVCALCGLAVLRGQRRRFMLGGFLLGVALACIIEGICFAGGL